MRIPWEGKSGAAKAVAVFATLLLVSLGLCGANFVAVMTAAGSSKLGDTLIVTAYLELLGMIVGGVGLVISLIVLAFSKSEE